MLKPIEVLLSRGIRRSTTAAQLCKQLDGRALAVRLDDTGIGLRISAEAGKLRVTARAEEDTDAIITGGLLSLQRLLGSDPETAIRDGSVKISGDAEIAAGFRELIRFAQPDLEEELSRLVGDAIAHQLGRMARELRGWGQRARHSLARSTAEYFQEESRDLAAPAEVHEFCQQVDELANAVARAEARLNQLRERQPR
jgi:ubiquinone biosynthesis protein UbiJ